MRSAFIVRGLFCAGDCRSLTTPLPTIPVGPHQAQDWVSGRITEPEQPLLTLVVGPHGAEAMTTTETPETVTPLPI